MGVESLILSLGIDRTFDLSSSTDPPLLKGSVQLSQMGQS